MLMHFMQDSLEVGPLPAKQKLIPKTPKRTTFDPPPIFQARREMITIELGLVSIVLTPFSTSLNFKTSLD